MGARCGAGAGRPCGGPLGAACWDIPYCCSSSRDAAIVACARLGAGWGGKSGSRGGMVGASLFACSDCSSCSRRYLPIVFGVLVNSNLKFSQS